MYARPPSIGIERRYFFLGAAFLPAAVFFLPVVFLPFFLPFLPFLATTTGLGFSRV